MWQEYFDTSWIGYYGDFLGNGSGLTAGDDKYSIGEMNCTKSAITVGATVSKIYWKTVNNTIYYNSGSTIHGTLAAYSSHGPDINGRMKPDIVAPGGMISGASSSYDADLLPGGTYYPALVVSKYVSPRNSRTYYYGIGQGTSFATPLVSGIVALMLQASPSLSPQGIKDVLYKTAIKDNFTTPSPDPALWGAGKINAYAAVKEVIRTTGIISILPDKLEIKVYPNPFSALFTIQYASGKAGNVMVEIANIAGEIIQSKLWSISAGVNQLPCQLNSSAKGVYFVNIAGNGGTVTKRIVLY
jgi:minor extracellular serine protease Vpr